MSHLFGQPGDEHLHAELEDAITEAVEFSVAESPTFDITVTEYDTLPKGRFNAVRTPSGQEVAEHVVEHYFEDIDFEQLYDELDQAVAEADVIAAFQQAMDLLLSKQRFLIADNEVATLRFQIVVDEDSGDWEYTALEQRPVRDA